jgi:hypothetical protein
MAFSISFSVSKAKPIKTDLSCALPKMLKYLSFFEPIEKLSAVFFIFG